MNAFSTAWEADRRESRRREVLSELAAVIRSARSAGDDAGEAARLAFPGVPAKVIAEAETMIADADAAAWWRSVENERART